MSTGFSGRTCPSCGAMSPRSAGAFCPQCRALLPANGAVAGGGEASGPAPAASTEAQRRQFMIAAGVAALLALLVFVVIVMLMRSGAPSAASEGHHAQDASLAGTNPAAPGSSTGSTPSTPTDPDAMPKVSSSANQTGADVAVFWRPATHDYFSSHPTAKRSAVNVPPGSSASVIRVDVENNGSAPVALNPQSFMLYIPGVQVIAEDRSLPGLMRATTVPPHSSVEGWLLFIKPWWDLNQGPEGQPSSLAIKSLPGAQITVSQHYAAPPTPPVTVDDSTGGGLESAPPSAPTNSKISPTRAPASPSQPGADV